MVLGLTGRYCAGKGAVARLLAGRGFRVMDADAISHEVLAERSAEVIAAFGEAVRGADGGVDRRALGRLVFPDPAAQERLQAILYPRITERILGLIREAPGDSCIDAPLLQRAGLERICDAVVFVTAPAPLRLLRAMRRDRLKLRDAWTRINAQRDVRPQSIGAGVDTYTVRNWGSARALSRRVARLARRLRG
jgi:dephospho-CoA kinase